jgi:hypothetical protein
MDCPDAETLAGAVGRLMKRPALDPSEGPAPAGAIRVHIRGGPQGYTATIEAGDRTREISDPWPTCAGLAEGLPLTLAILLDSDEPLTPTPNPSPPAPTSPTAAGPAPPAPSGPRAARPPAARPAERATGLTAYAGPTGSSGILGPFTFGVGGDADLRFASTYAIGAGAFWLVPRTIDFPPGQVDVSLWAGFLRVCAYVAGAPDRTRLALCAHGAAGVLEGQGSGYEENETSTRPWIAFGGAGLIEGSIWKRLGWAARVSFFIPAVREKFAVRGIEGDAFDPAQIGVLFSIGPRLTIW